MCFKAGFFFGLLKNKGSELSSVFSQCFRKSGNYNRQSS